MTYNRKDTTVAVKYGTLAPGTLFRFADGINAPEPIYRKLRDNLAGYDLDQPQANGVTGGVISMSPTDDVVAV